MTEELFSPSQDIIATKSLKKSPTASLQTFEERKYHLYSPEKKGMDFTVSIEEKTCSQLFKEEVCT
jgi:hypothetical protein